MVDFNRSHEPEGPQSSRPNWAGLRELAETSVRTYLGDLYTEPVAAASGEMIEAACDVVKRQPVDLLRFGERLVQAGLSREKATTVVALTAGIEMTGPAMNLAFFVSDTPNGMSREMLPEVERVLGQVFAKILTSIRRTVEMVD